MTDPCKGYRKPVVSYFAFWALICVFVVGIVQPSEGHVQRVVSGNPYREVSEDRLVHDRAQGGDERQCCNPLRPCYEFVPPLRFILAVICLGCTVAINVYWRGWGRLLCIVPFLCTGWLILCGHKYWCKGEDGNYREYSHGGQSVSQKDLTTYRFCNTVNLITNVLGIDKQTAIISVLAEGSSIRSIERVTGVHRDTIMRLGVKVGQGCTALLDEKMRNLPCRLLQLDEIWGFIGKKERHVPP